MTMQARRLVKSPMTGTFSSHGKSADMTCGMVSPTIMQNAIMPPNALPLRPKSEIGSRRAPQGIEGTHNAHCAIWAVLVSLCTLDGQTDGPTDIAINPGFPKHALTVA